MLASAQLLANQVRALLIDQPTFQNEKEAGDVSGRDEVSTILEGIGAVWWRKM